LAGLRIRCLGREDSIAEAAPCGPLKADTDRGNKKKDALRAAGAQAS